MQTLTISAVSQQSAQGFLDALAEFETELVEGPPGRYHVVVSLKGSDRAIVEVLRALETHVSRRADGPAKLNLDEHFYTLHPS